MPVFCKLLDIGRYCQLSRAMFRQIASKLPKLSSYKAIGISAVTLSVFATSHLSAEAPKIYTSQEVKDHNTSAKRIWVSHGDGVYDITEFIKQHPGLEITLIFLTIEDHKRYCWLQASL